MEKENTKNRLLDVAHQVFKHYGIRKTTLDDIAIKFGKGKTAIYYYYNSRDTIFKAVLLKEVNSAIMQIKSEVELEINPVEQVKAFINMRLKVVAQTPVLNEASIENKFKSIKWIEQLSENYMKDKIKILSNILHDGIQCGVFKFDNPQLVALAIETALNGLDAYNLTNGLDDKHRDKLINILFYGLIQ